MVDHTRDELLEAFDFLDDLRESGQTNMFGASSYVMRELGWPQTETRSAVALWMETFSDAPIEERVATALNK